MGLDSRDITPDLVRIVVHLSAEVRSFDRVAKTLGHVLGNRVSSCTVRRVVGQVGNELSAHQQSNAEDAHDNVIVPELAVVSCDGGRIRTREPDNGPGVSNPQWRETKNAAFERMASDTCGEDPCPELPTAFAHPDKVASIAESAPLDVADTDDSAARKTFYKGPKRILRTCVSSMSCSDDFGATMKREAQRRRFFEASRGAFLGDGLAWNWTIWKRHFSSFIPVLDFIHAIQYLFAAAKAMTDTDAAAWTCYHRFATACWQGHIKSIITALKADLRDRGIEDVTLAEEDPLKPIADAARYFTNNHTRMDYPKYRKMGLPVTSSPMESLIKQINLRVKGTEMTWNDPAGAEAILQIRAAALSEDNRLDDYLRRRAGWQFVRRTTGATAA